MAEIKGRLTVCDRCGKEIFNKAVSEEELDGGFTKWTKFESLPKGWSRHEGKNLCPDCASEWNKIETAFMNQKLRFFRGESE